MVSNFLDGFFDSVCKDFIEYFCIYVHEGNWFVICFFCGVFMYVEYEAFG